MLEMDELIMTAIFADCADAESALRELLARGHCRESIGVLMTAETRDCYLVKEQTSDVLPTSQIAAGFGSAVRLDDGDDRLPAEVKSGYESGLQAGGIILGFRPRAVTEADEVARLWQDYRGDFIYY